MPDSVSDLVRRLAENAEAVCRYYLSNGRRSGGYWLAGDVQNSPGQSLYVRLRGPLAGRGAAGKWTDAATGEHGDLLDLIAASQRQQGTNALDEGRRFLGLVQRHDKPTSAATTGSPEAAQRLFAMAQPIGGTLASTYLRERGIEPRPQNATALRFHPRCFYRPDDGSPPNGRSAWPALIAAVTRLDGTLSGVQRTWLAPEGGKAPVSTPRRAMGHLLGHAVRFGGVCDVMAVGEGIETVLSLRCVLPTIPMAAALSAAHLAAFLSPPALRRLYIARDNDPAGQWAAGKLIDRAQRAGIEARVLAPTLADFNDDLRQLGGNALAAGVRAQLAPEDLAHLRQAPERCGQMGLSLALLDISQLGDHRRSAPADRAAPTAF